MKCQNLLSGKSKKKYFKMSAEIFTQSATCYQCLFFSVFTFCVCVCVCCARARARVRACVCCSLLLSLKSNMNNTIRT